MPKLSANIEKKKILSRAHENFKQQNKVLETAIIVINYYMLLKHIIKIVYLIRCIIVIFLMMAF